MTASRKPSLLLFICLAVVMAAVSIGCKKTPPAVTTEPEPPAVTQTEPPAEPVKEAPMKPAVEEKPAPVKRMSAEEYNRQGILKTVYFDFDKFEVRPDQRQAMQQNAEKLQQGDLAKFSILIEGHCDERGTSEYNMALGDRRANATKQYLINLGVPASRIRTISYGEERPGDPGHNEQAWARNRRAELVLEEG